MEELAHLWAKNQAQANNQVPESLSFHGTAVLFSAAGCEVKYLYVMLW